MSRNCHDHESGPMLEAASRWREVALLKDRSIFGERAIWTIDGLKELEHYFIENLDEGEGRFLEKLKTQLAPTLPATKQLAAELLWVMFLCPSNTSAGKKREIVREVFGWSGEHLAVDHPLLSNAVLEGVGSAGMGYNNHRWRELAFGIRFGIAIKQLPESERRRVLSEGWGFAEWVAGIQGAEVRQLRHMLLFILFPDTFERIFGGGDRRLIVEKCAGLPAAKVREMQPIEIDRHLARLRAETEAANPGTSVDFYVEPLRSRWKVSGFEEYTADIDTAHVRLALEEIDKGGVPSGADSTTYDLIDGSRRYPPKLVLSLAAKHATGKEFDRLLFSAGMGSPAFKLLQGLGFHIERKDFVETLLGKFLAQASQGDSLVVKGYPDSYRSLTVRVSFGKGGFAKVPWIAFLGPGQENQSGIYPVFLYYKTDKVLVLARGISDTEVPPIQWPQDQSDRTIDSYFVERFGHHAERYGESFVYRVYKVPDDIQVNQVTLDLDTVIAEYHDLLNSAKQAAYVAPGATGAQVLVAREPEPESKPKPYSIKEAVESLFITQERFEEILAIWQKRKNLVIQGPPGVGKTFFYRRLAYALMKEVVPARIASVQFHPSYAYEDFVQGFRPTQGGFALRQGIFTRFCDVARKDSGRNYVFVIDEINRGNLAKIFGELLMLLEADKRSEDWAIALAYAGPEAPKFYVPENVYLLGLMNTADRSLAVVDYALRRRFAFAHLRPEYESVQFAEHMNEKGLSAVLAQKIVARMTALNDEIAKDKANLGPGYCIGHSFFCDPPEEAALHEDWYKQVVTTEIGPLLDEYYFDDLDRARQLVDRLLRP